MDPISAIGLVLTAVQLTNSCLKECRKFIGPSKHSTIYVRSVADDLWAFNGSLKNLQTHYEIYEDSQARSIALPSIIKPLSDCNVALDSIREHLESKNLLKKIITGARFDTALKRHLICLKNSRILFHEVLQADKIIVLHAVERYSRNLAEDIRDFQNIIGEIDGRNRSDFEQVHGSLSSIHNGQKDILRSHEGSRTRKESQARAKKDSKIIDWLSPLNFWAKQNDVLRSRSESTGTWILEFEEFKNWVVGSGKTLWCTGIPGAGKTVFTSVVVDHLERIVAGPRVAVSYVYCSYKDEANQTPTCLIGSILQQILTGTMAVTDDLRTLYEHHEPSKTGPTIEELSVQLQAYVRNLEKFYVVIDALDECPDVKREELLKHVRNLQPAVNLMITTRPASHVANGFPKAACVEIRAKDTDIQSYCEAKIRSDHRLHFVQDDADLMDVVINTIAENAQKMFLLAVLHIESLASQLNKAQVRNALQKLPKGLDDTYREALQRIARQGQPSVEMAHKILSLISYAYRPLTIKELQCALAVTPGLPTFDEDAMTPESKLVSVCAGLVAIDPQSSIIRLVHYTTQEFFEKIRDSEFPNARAEIAVTCLTYLSFDHAGYNAKSCNLYEMEKNPFFSYAAQYWRDHMRATPNPNFNELILRILSQPKKVDCIFQAMDEAPFFSDMDGDTTVPPLCAAAFLGLESVVVLLLKRGADLNESVTGNGSTALCIAVRFAQLEVMKVLLDYGASLDNHNRPGCTPLLATVSAARLTNEKRAVAAARLLLNQGANINIQSKTVEGGLNTSTLMEAAHGGFEQMVELLLTRGADANLRAHDGLTALHMAHPRRHRIFQSLVGHGADLHARDNHKETTLLRVSGHSREEVEPTVRALLDLGADIHSRNRLGETALFKAAAMGNCRIIQVLVEYGADIHAHSELGRSVLFSTIESDHGRPEKVVPLLLDLGANPHSQDSAGDTALARAAAKGLSRTVKVILDHKPNIDTSNGAGDTALTLAAAAEATLGRGECWEVNCKRIDVASLMAAAVERNLITIELLLNHGASVDLKNKAGDSALTLAAAIGKMDAVKLLLEHGANIDTNNATRDTALTLAAATEATLEGPKPYDARYPDVAFLMATAMERCLITIDGLLTHGASVDLKNKTGDTALTLAAATGKLDAVKLLLSHGANAHVKNEAGDTALSLTTQNGHSEVHQLLLEHLSEPKQPPVYTEVE